MPAAFFAALVALLQAMHCAGADGMRVAVVTGANRGIGYATAKEMCVRWNGTMVVIVVARDQQRGLLAANRLKRVGCTPEFFHMDISHRSRTEALRHYLLETFGGLDILINNAANKFFSTSTADLRTKVRSTLHVNFYSTMNLCFVLFPLLRPHARVVNLSGSCGVLPTIRNEELRKEFSAMGMTTGGLHDLMAQFKDSVLHGTQNETGWGADPYCVSKLAVSALTALQQEFVTVRRPDADILVNCYNPGDVNSRMTDFKGTVEPYVAASNVVKLATLPENTTSPMGQLVWHDMSVVDWRVKMPD